MAVVLGLNCTFHEQAACVLASGKVRLVAEEERFIGVRHGYPGTVLPLEAMEWCLQNSDVKPTIPKHIAYAFAPWVRFRRGVARASLAMLRGDRHQLKYEWRLLLANLLTPRSLQRDMSRELSLKTSLVSLLEGEWRLHFVHHHVSHAASAFFLSPFENAAILSMDGIGEMTTTLLAQGEENGIRVCREVRYPASLGFFMEEITKYLGFRRNNGEHKVMGLAAYGKPRYKEQLAELLEACPNGRYKVYIDFYKSGLLGVHELSELLGPPRLQGGKITERHADIAASAQIMLEETVLHMAKWLHAKTGSENLCMAGGVALNCVMNERIRAEGPFKRVFVQPAAHDAGTALGAALWVHHCRLGNPRAYVMDHVYLGPSFSDEMIERMFIERNIPFTRCECVADTVADLLAAGKVIGLFQGRMEFGPRALGNRSMLADPRNPDMRDRVNIIKGRENFRPLAPAILEEQVGEFFECAEPSPFMLFARKVKPAKRGLIPAAVHVDGTARVQTVSRMHNPVFHDIISGFWKRAGVPVVINTSLNYAGKPIVCTVEQALDCFINCGIDCLAIGPFLLEKRATSADEQIGAIAGSEDLDCERAGDSCRPAQQPTSGCRVSGV